jgi:hypothetical protein
MTTKREDHCGQPLYNFQDTPAPEFPGLFDKVRPYGSAAVNGEGHDLDLLALSLPESEGSIISILSSCGWRFDDAEDIYMQNHHGIHMRTARLGQYNLVILNCPVAYNMYLRAQRTVELLCLTGKMDRITVFDSIMLSYPAELQDYLRNPTKYLEGRS